MSAQSQNEREEPKNISVNANSSANAGNYDTDENGISSGDSRHQTPTGFESDKKGHSQEDSPVTASKIADLSLNGNSAEVADRAGTVERKPYGDTELNKGLEAQAEDAEVV